MARRGGNRRKPLAETLLGKLYAILGVSATRCAPSLNTDIACGNCGNSPFLPATTPRQRGCYSAAMTDQALPDQIPDRLSTNPKSTPYDEALLTRGVGIKVDGQETTTVE